MAWNEPEKNDDAPRGQRPEQGRPAEHPFRTLQRRLEAMLRSGGVGSEPPPQAASGSLAGLVLGGLAALWIATGFFQVEASERAVIQRFGKFTAVRNPGLGWALPWPIESVTKVNVSQVNSVEYRSRMLTADVNLVEIRSAIQFQYSDPVKMLFQVRDPESTLREVSESAIREVIGQARLEQVLGVARQKITEDTRELIQRTLDGYSAGVRVTSVNLTDVQVPEAVLASQRDANKAIEDRDRFSKEAQAYANDILPKAQGAAQRLMQDAEAYKSQVVANAEGDVARFNSIYGAYSQAPEVTRQRMYIEAIESILGRSKKVFLDAKGGASGNMIYLPLDKLVEQGVQRHQAPAAQPAPAQPAARPTQEMESITVEGRTRGER